MSERDITAALAILALTWCAIIRTTRNCYTTCSLISMQQVVERLCVGQKRLWHDI